MLKLEGSLYEMGVMEDGTGIRIRTAEGQLVAITGLSMAQCAELKHHFGDDLVLTVVPKEGAPS